MGALVAVLSKKGENVAEKALAMLEALRHRYDGSYGIASATTISMVKAATRTTIKNFSSPRIIGYGLAAITSNDKPQPILAKNYALTFEGRIYQTESSSKISFILNFLGENLEEKARELVKSVNGSYTFAISTKNNLIVGRDPVGVRPLYYGENNELCAVAPEKKALWKIGIRETTSFPPGNIAFVDENGFRFECIRVFERKKPLENLDTERAAEKLAEILSKSVFDRVKDVKKIAIAFSGGVDSGVIALLAKEANVDVQLFYVGCKDKPEFRNAHLAAEELGLPLTTYCICKEDVEEALPKVLWLIEEADPVKTCIAVPIFLTAQKASEDGHKVLLTGQGGDELFGGYWRYLRILKEKGAEILQEKLYLDVVNSYLNNFERDEKLCSFHKIELRLPFADSQLIEYALKLPLNMKISSEKDELRKMVLRKAAEKLGLPKSIAYRKKKAIQYSTGVAQLLRHLAKKKGLSLRDYITEIFNELNFERGIP